MVVYKFFKWTIIDGRLSLCRSFDCFFGGCNDFSFRQYMSVVKVHECDSIRNELKSVKRIYVSRTRITIRRCVILFSGTDRASGSGP